METTLGKMQPFAKRTILFVDTLYDQTGVADRIRELGLKAFVVHDVSELQDKEKLPHIDTIVVDSLSVVSLFITSGLNTDSIIDRMHTRNRAPTVYSCCAARSFQRSFESYVVALFSAPRLILL